MGADSSGADRCGATEGRRPRSGPLLKSSLGRTGSGAASREASFGGMGRSFLLTAPLIEPLVRRRSGRVDSQTDDAIGFRYFYIRSVLSTVFLQFWRHRSNNSLCYFCKSLFAVRPVHYWLAICR